MISVILPASPPRLTPGVSGRHPPTVHRTDPTTDPPLAIDLGAFPGLRRLSAAWPQVEGTIAESGGLRTAALRGYQAVDLEPLRPLRLLSELRFKDRPRLRSLGGVSSFPELRLLGVYLATGLADISDLAGAGALEDLTLEACRKIGRIDVIAANKALRRLNLSECGGLVSLVPIVGLALLEDLRLFGSTRILDGDLTPISGLPRLRTLRTQSRRLYRPSVEDIQAALPHA